jgi:TRAP transporter TAXI family solute receptor
MQSKFAIPVIAVSIVTAVIFGFQWVRGQQQVTELVIATGGKDGEYYAFAQAFATVVNRHQPKIRIAVLATEGSRQNLSLLDQRQVQLAIVQSDTTIQNSVQAVASLFPEVFHLIAQPNSGIRQVGDLHGKRVALMPKGSGSYNLFWSLSRHYGLTEADFAPVSLPPDRRTMPYVKAK